MSYEVMAALLIYAQTGTLPDEESDDTYLGRPNIYMAPKKKLSRFPLLEQDAAEQKELSRLYMQIPHFWQV